MSEAAIHSTPNRIPTAEELGFDPGALREKYAAERTKRLRADGNNQYQEIIGQYGSAPFWYLSLFIRRSRIPRGSYII